MAPSDRVSDVALMAGLGVALRVAFWAFTDRVWEDALITVAHARNAVEGLGLTHHAGEPVTQGFTSAISVLVPLIGEAIAAGGGLVALRLASLIAIVVTIVAADALGRRLGLDRWARLLVLGYLAVDANQIFYGMSGMETQVAVAALVVSAWTVAARNPLAGVALGVALLTRPDFLIWAGIVVILLFLRDRVQLIRVAAGSLVVAPWLIFTTVYYGSPIPQTIVAKAIAFTTLPLDVSLAGWLGWVPHQIGTHFAVIVRTFAPFLEDSLASRTPVPRLALVLISLLVAALAVIGAVDRRRSPAWTPLISFVAAYLVYRILFLQPIYSDWYVPPFTAIAVFLVAAGVQRVTRYRPEGGRVLAATFVVVFAFPLPWMFGAERAIQVDVEDGVRVKVGEALAALVPPGEGVVSESAGYVGYGSRVLLFDYPGLTSPTALRAVRSLPAGERTIQAMVDVLRPPWLALRPVELGDLRSAFPKTAAMYAEVRRIGAGGSEIEFAGFSKATVDTEFIILRRR